MAGRNAFDRPSYLEDIRDLKARGLSMSEIARELGMSRDTLYRIVREGKR